VERTAQQGQLLVRQPVQLALLLAEVVPPVPPERLVRVAR